MARFPHVQGACRIVVMHSVAAALLLAISAVPFVSANASSTILPFAISTAPGYQGSRLAHARYARCNSGQVSVAPTNKGLGAALGHSGRWFRVRLHAGEACTLQGYPKVVLLDARLHRIPSRVRHGGYIISSFHPAARTVILSRRHDGYFAVEQMDVPSPPRPCIIVPYLDVTLPGTAHPVLTRGPVGLCPPADGVSPIEPSPSLG